MAVRVFRFSAAQVRDDQRHSIRHFCLSEKVGWGRVSTPINIIAQELCNNIRRCLVHDDVIESQHRPPTWATPVSGTRITGGGSGYAALLAHAE